jgi:hypothetical protein
VSSLAHCDGRDVEWEGESEARYASVIGYA